MKTVVILQSSYIPWKGYFDLVNDADEFIFLDDVQFTKQDWRARNKIKSKTGVQWMTVPVGSNINRLICNVKINDHSWQMKHYKTLFLNYEKCPAFNKYKELLKFIYLDIKWQNLSELNQFLIKKISAELKINTVFKDSREYSATGTKESRLIDIITKSGGNKYISGPSARDYINQHSFISAGIDLVWKDYSGYPEYPQNFPPFDHGVSILDLLFNVGDDAPWYIWGWRE